MRAAKWTYLIAVHLLLLLFVFLFIGATQLLRADRRLPGSRLSSGFSNAPELREWGHFIKHDHYGVIAAVLEEGDAVTGMSVALPDTNRTWTFSRDDAAALWILYVNEFDAGFPADPATTDTMPSRFLLDGEPESAAADGLPDALIEVEPERRLLRYAIPEPIASPQP